MKVLPLSLEKCKLNQYLSARMTHKINLILSSADLRCRETSHTSFASFGSEKWSSFDRRVNSTMKSTYEITNKDSI